MVAEVTVKDDGNEAGDIENGLWSIWHMGRNLKSFKEWVTEKTVA